MSSEQVGLIGLAVMGQNLVLNMERNGFRVAVFNRTTARTDEFIAGPAAGKNIKGTKTIQEFMACLERPRKIIILVKAGAPVDAMIDQVKPYLEKGDILFDGGNTYYPDTDRRVEQWGSEGIKFIGSGISGGEEGALMGPCIMPGGPEDAYNEMAPILTTIAAQVDDGPCCAYIGPRSAGHYVKMVHNGIEYGIMQLIAESYDILGRALGLKAPEIGDIMAEWNAGELGSYLMEITEEILHWADPETDGYLVDHILDTAKQKGTGKWTSQDSFNVGVPTPTINAAVTGRVLSGYKAERVEAAKALKGVTQLKGLDRDTLIDSVRDALYGSIVASYAQGMALLRLASSDYDYNLDLPEIARIWKGGCIIRAKMLDPIKEAYRDDPELPNLMVAPHFVELLNRLQAGWRITVQTAVGLGIPSLALGASLAYYDSYRAETLPANLTQGQRDYFGAHTFERTDKEGTYHINWMEEKKG
ncbi:NADP-dependent phosphogluconate dehydrogenase [candidate division KSB1 bacterium]